MIKKLSFNPMQTAISILQPKYNYLVSGRGFGKSTYFGYQIHNIVQNLPGASAVIAARTKTHVLTSILPAAFDHLERMGYIRDIHYVIGKKPPKEWGLPYNAPVKDFENYITFFNPNRPVGFHLASQQIVGAGRGPNTDFLLTDETLRLDKKRLDNELAPTLRANKSRFKIPWHHGQYHSTSMPYTQQSRWILDEGNYYMDEYGIDYYGLWRKVVNLQLQLLEIDKPKEFRRQWNEIQLVRRKMKPLLSKDGTKLFTLSNAIDNWMNIGLSYIKQQKKTLPEAIFLIEIMNQLITLNENSFYALDENIHTYYDSWDDNFTNDLAINNNFNFSALKNRKSESLNKKYYNPNDKIYLFFDWGGTISFCLAAQFKQNDNQLNIIKEFYVTAGGDMPQRLMQDFAYFFEKHKKREIIFVRDSFGDNKSIQKSKTINQDAIDKLIKNKWKVHTKKHRHKEPPMFEKWQLMQKILGERDKNLFKIRIDGNNCKYLIIAMKDTKAKQVGNEFSKDKSLERKQGADQRTAPHATDALDKGCYWLKSELRKPLFIDSKI